MQLSNLFSNSTFNFSELNLSMLQNATPIAKTAAAVTATSNNNIKSPLNSKELLINQNDNILTQARIRNPPYLIRRGGSVKVKNSAFSLVSTATSTSASSSLSSSSVSPTSPLLIGALSTKIGDSINDNFITSFPTTLVSSSVVTTGSNNIKNDSNTFFSKKLKTKKKLISRTNSNNIIRNNNNDITNKSQHSIIPQKILNSITNIGNTNNDIFLNGTSIDNVLSNTDTNALTLGTNNITLNWMNHLQILAAAATAGTTPISLSPTDNNYLLFSDKTTVVPTTIKSNIQVPSFPVKLNTSDEKNDSFTVAFNKMFDTDWTNDEDLLFARLIVVRLKKFGTKDRRMVRFI